MDYASPILRNALPAVALLQRPDFFSLVNSHPALARYMSPTVLSALTDLRRHPHQLVPAVQASAVIAEILHTLAYGEEEAQAWAPLLQAFVAGGQEAVGEWGPAAVAGCTALHVAAGRGWAEACEQLGRRHPGLVGARDRAGYTPLHRAVAGGHTAAAVALLAARASSQAPGADGLTPIDLALEAHADGLVLLLLDSPPPTTTPAPAQRSMPPLPPLPPPPPLTPPPGLIRPPSWLSPSLYAASDSDSEPETDSSDLEAPLSPPQRDNGPDCSEDALLVGQLTELEARVQELTAKLAKAEKALEEAEDKTQCSICYTSRADIAFLDCGHVAICSGCLKTNAKHLTTCIICGAVARTVKLYFP